LDDQGAEEDKEEDRVVEKALEDVEFIGLKLAGVDFVEELEHHEDLEEDGVMHSGFRAIIKA
jgi:hypothetical protein